MTDDQSVVTDDLHAVSRSDPTPGPLVEEYGPLTGDSAETTDEEITSELTEVRGVGPWTAEMGLSEQRPT